MLNWNEWNEHSHCSAHIRTRAVHLNSNHRWFKCGEAKMSMHNWDLRKLKRRKKIKKRKVREQRKEVIDSLIEVRYGRINPFCVISGTQASDFLSESSDSFCVNSTAAVAKSRIPLENLISIDNRSYFIHLACTRNDYVMRSFCFSSFYIRNAHTYTRRYCASKMKRNIRSNIKMTVDDFVIATNRTWLRMCAYTFALALPLSTFSVLTPNTDTYTRSRTTVLTLECKLINSLIAYICKRAHSHTRATQL